MAQLTVVLAQINPLVGDIDGNVDRVLAFVKQHCEKYPAAMVVFPELTLTGYPPEDLLLRSSIGPRVARALERLSQAKCTQSLVVGYPLVRDGQLYNMAGVISQGRLLYQYAKRCLPNYQVFDEKRYFSPGLVSGVFSFGGLNLGISICEDIWDGSPLEEFKGSDVDLVLNLNASPFHKEKQARREALLAERSRSIDAPIVYVNQVGAQDELVFDGGSVATARDGSVIARAPLFEEHALVLQFEATTRTLSQLNRDGLLAHERDSVATVYRALVLGVRDYVNKNGFKGVVLGLSGGIDSALTLAVAVDALGAERVQAVMMPFRYTSQMSLEDAAAQAQTLGVRYHVIGIEAIYGAFTEALQGVFANAAADKTEENIQARSRGVLLMAISNKLGYLVLTTGNKSEMAVGYATLYGDMAGGLDVLKDVPKTLVFELARHCNRQTEIIPERVITRPPSAELAPGQVDEDSLPPYAVLDQILELYIERDQSAQAIIDRGFESEAVMKVLRMVDINEYKRRQAPIGIRISERAFGRDRRYPITNGWSLGD